MRNSMVWPGFKHWTFAVTLMLVMTVSGCSPASQPANDTTTGPGQPVNASDTWNALLESAQAGEATGRYMVKMDVDVSESSLHSLMSVYGGINPPNRGSLDIVESTNDIQFYQQGEAAYYKDNNRWSETTPMSDIDVFPGYIRMIQQAMNQHIPVMKLPDVYVHDEYCTVYQATLPATMPETLALLGGRVDNETLHDAQYTFFVGKSDHMLRQVQTESVSALQGIGPMVVNTNTLLFDLGSKLANVQLPQDLAKQLEGKTN